MIYHNGCHDCKKMAPVWAKVAKEYADVPDVVIAKMDGEKNQVEDVHISRYPTFLYYPKGVNASQSE